MVPSDLVLTVLVLVLFFVLFFFSLVRPHCIACFGLGPFLRLLVTVSSLLVSLLSFSPLGVSCRFLGVFLQFLVLSLLRWGSSPLGFASLSCRRCAFLDSTPSLLSC